MGESLDGGGVIEDEDEIGKLEADLAADASASGRNSTGSAPGAIGQSGNDETAAEATGSDEAGLENGDDGEALGICQNRRWNDLVGSEGLARVDEGGQDLATLLTLR